MKVNMKETEYYKSGKHSENARYNLYKNNITKVKCAFCDKETNLPNIKKHEKSCYMNPVNIRKCPVCDNIIKNKTSTTCSYSCSNTYYNGIVRNVNIVAYRTICFRNHKKKCVICNEKNMVEVHHLDENTKNNNPANLIPLCPTHHRYWHLGFKHLIEKQIYDYIENWSE